MAGSDHVNCSRIVVDLIDDSIVADPDTPQITLAFELLDTMRPRFAGKSLDSLVDSPGNRSREVLDLSRGARSNDDFVLGHSILPAFTRRLRS